MAWRGDGGGRGAGVVALVGFARMRACDFAGKINARNLAPADLPAVPDLATVDVSFISLTKILPAVDRVLPGGASQGADQAAI